MILIEKKCRKDQKMKSMKASMEGKIMVKWRKKLFNLDTKRRRISEE